MGNTAITVDHISKKYNLLHKEASRSDSLMESASVWARSLLKGGPKRSSTEEFWALKDVSFEVKQGDRVGVIGRNGAGKSTLLKILSRIVLPTQGRIEYEGRIASLLEVGTGFHGDLSGRENIYLNGSILGMSKHEIDRKFDEIVEFAEIEKFLDTPVKRYSSGMYVRLAFAVAAHLEPEILIVDEVLAVGDAAFQRKCLGKMSDVAGQGRTIIFVSHNMEAVQKVCNKGILLQKGQLIENGDIDKVAKRYLASGNLNDSYVEFEAENTEVAGYPISLRIEDLSGELAIEARLGQPYQMRVRFRINRPTPHFIIALGLKNSGGMPVRTSFSLPGDIAAGEYEAVFRFEDVILSAGIYPLVLGLSSYESSFFYKEDIASLQISDFSSLLDDPRIVRNSGVGIILNPIHVDIKKV